MQKNFNDFLENITLTEAQMKDAKTKYEGVCGCLDRHFYDSSYNEAHKFLFGSYKHRTCVRPIVPEQDVDVLFKIDKDTYEKYKDNPGGLLQEVRNALKDTYTTTDRIKAWGKVVLVNFAEGKHNVEVLPALEQDDNTFLIPNTENGGSWDVFDPRAQVDAFCSSNKKTQCLTKKLAKMMKTWGRNTKTLDYSSYIMLEDIIKFLNDYYPDGQGDTKFDQIVEEFLTYVHSRLDDTDSRKSHLKTAKTRAANAIEYEKQGKHIEASEEWRKVFGSEFPKSEKNEAKNGCGVFGFKEAPRPWGML